MSEPFFSVENLNSGYGDVQVLWDVSLDVQPGEMVCLVGSNGAGKSTLLRCVSGLIPARGGKIRMRGKDLANTTPDYVLAAGIAHVPEGRRLFSGMNVRNNLLMGAYLRRDADILKDLDWVCSLFPILAERIRQDAGTLSGGEQQMAAIARGIMSRPALLMIDELSLGLAPLVVEDIGKALLQLNGSGLSILLVEQDVMTALELVRRGFVLESGRVIKSGLASDLTNDPSIRESYMGI
jgi:branched-chain amino acid transport system ATP-binding protein